MVRAIGAGKSTSLSMEAACQGLQRYLYLPFNAKLSLGLVQQNMKTENIDECRSSIKAWVDASNLNSLTSTWSPPWERFGQELKALQAPDKASFHYSHREGPFAIHG